MPNNNSREIARPSDAFASNTAAAAKAVADLGVAAAAMGTPHLLLNPSWSSSIRFPAEASHLDYHGGTLGIAGKKYRKNLFLLFCNLVII